MSQIVLEVPDISCAHCVQTVQTTLQAQPGVQSIDVSLPSKTVTLSYDESQFNLQQASAALDDEGYPVATTRSA